MVVTLMTVSPLDFIISLNRLKGNTINQKCCEVIFPKKVVVAAHKPCITVLHSNV